MTGFGVAGHSQWRRLLAVLSQTQIFGMVAGGTLGSSASGDVPGLVD